MSVVVRPARPEELDAAGKVVMAAYRQDELLAADDDYAAELGQPARRASHTVILVAVLEAAGGSAKAAATILGCATLVLDHASPWAEVMRPDEAELRMVGVAPAARRRGIGRQLTLHACRMAHATGRTAMVLSSRPEMTAAHAMYAGLGFSRLPERDWFPLPGFPLLVFGAPLPVNGAAAYCPRCGHPRLADATHEPCRRALSLEPPRFCQLCGRRMVVQVTPSGWRATCSRHGELASS